MIGMGLRPLAWPTARGPLGRPDPAGQLAVADRLAVGDPRQLGPHLPSGSRCRRAPSAGRSRCARRRSTPRAACRLLQHRRHVVGVVAAVAALVGQPEADQHVAVALQHETADRGVAGHGGGGGGCCGHAARPFVVRVGISWCGGGGQRPQVRHGVAPPRAPGLGRGDEVGRVVGQAEGTRRPADAEVGRHERVGVAQRAHGHVLGRPGPDAGQGHERAAAARGVGARVDDDVADARPPRPMPRSACRRPPAWRTRPGRARPARRAPPAWGRDGSAPPSAAGSASPAASTAGRPRCVHPAPTPAGRSRRAPPARSRRLRPARAGRGRAGPRAPRSGSARSASAMATGSASRSSSWRQRATAVVRSRRSASRSSASR